MTLPWSHCTRAQKVARVATFPVFALWWAFAKALEAAATRRVGNAEARAAHRAELRERRRREAEDRRRARLDPLARHLFGDAEDRYELLDQVAAAKALPYPAYLQTEHWRRVADACKERAGWRCEECGRAGPLDAHHLTYDRLGAELPEDLMALCAAHCHPRALTPSR